MKSPYLIKNRLSDVIAAIQVMGVYKFYKLPFDSWADRISGTKATSAHWRTVFEDHPEFFRLDGNRERASLVWRRQYPRRFHVDKETRLSQTDYEQLPDAEKQDRISRNPLTSDDIKALISTAINLHSRAIEEEKEKRWWTPVLGGVGAFLGALVGAFLKR